MKLLLYFYHFIQKVESSCRISLLIHFWEQLSSWPLPNDSYFSNQFSLTLYAKKNTVIGSNRYKLRLHTDNPNKEYLTNRVSTQIKGWVGTGAQEWRTAKKAADKKSLSTWLKQPLQPRPQLISFLSQWKIHVENFTYRPSFETLNSGRTLQTKKLVY